MYNIYNFIIRFLKILMSLFHVFETVVYDSVKQLFQFQIYGSSSVLSRLTKLVNYTFYTN